MAEVRELGERESRVAAAALLELRPQLETPEAVVERVDSQRAAGYRLAGVVRAG